MTLHLLSALCTNRIKSYYIREHRQIRHSGCKAYSELPRDLLIKAGAFYALAWLTEPKAVTQPAEQDCAKQVVTPCSRLFSMPFITHSNLWSESTEWKILEKKSDICSILFVVVVADC